MQSQEQAEGDVNSTGESEIRHRERWLTLQLEHPEASKTTLRQMAPATYAWLYKNDREWLNQNSPILRVPVSSNHRVDWQHRDRQVLAQVQDVVALLLNAKKPIRLTIGRIGKTVDLQALLLYSPVVESMQRMNAFVSTSVLAQLERISGSYHFTEVRSCSVRCCERTHGSPAHKIE